MNLKITHLVLLVLVALLVAGAVNMGSSLVQEVQSSDGVIGQYHDRLNKL